jgi:Na+-transporting methylmalonyl-CoA/oxaloacetate decarboxylase gamma subunit
MYSLLVLLNEGADIMIRIATGMAIGSSVLLILWNCAIELFGKCFHRFRSTPPNSDRSSSNRPRLI